ncbi:hypothetical protein S40285_06177 [Stachybotrys chlorohalonatus IBT 40285]|uniref:Endosomal/vacuolar adapter protein YPT35 n=1 Tax=Stachybotrys chlorohalonatus (strain IBT 40285) TaxID=1283841 RepID=A0A084QA52_STAC4|nr:hypothetical protein S40285_06177 [Stachybotrys chlorohalonata IBT 40285]
MDSHSSTTAVPRHEDSSLGSDDDSFHDADSHDASHETASSTLSPSSLSSPPFWMKSSIHRRTASNMSVESVLPTGAITLCDNETSDSRRWYAKSVEIPDYTIVNGNSTGIGAFVVWNIKVETLTVGLQSGCVSPDGILTSSPQGSSIPIHKRYSEFDELRRQLTLSFPYSRAAIPDLPPKGVVAKFRPNFLEKRRAGLQYFLNCIILNPEFSGSPVLRDFIFS